MLNNLSGGARPVQAAIVALAVVIALFHFYALAIRPLDPMIFRAWHLAGLVAFAGVCGLTSDNRITRVTGLAFAVAAVWSAIYVTVDLRGITMRAGVRPSEWDIILGTALLVTVLEVTRRTAGTAIFVLALAAILYALFGDALPDVVSHRGYSFERLVTYLFTTNGIFNIPLGSAATYIYLFVLFGSLMMASGAGDYLIKVAMALSGKARGGPAKVSIVASGFFGMINGTSAGNVVATGSMTIPLMKRAGYSPRVSSSVEAASSSGGQILPPVMGAAAFLMVDMTGIAYSSIIVAATIPALLYFLAVFAMAHFEAVNRGIGGVDAEDYNVDRKTLLTGLYFLAPPAVLIVSLLWVGTSIILAGIFAIATTFVVSWVSRSTRIGPARAAEASVDAARSILAISATCATAGIIMGVLNLTGMGLKIASVIVTLTEGSLLLTLLMAMLVTIVLGMGLPTVAAYAITGTVVAPAITRLGVEPIAAHLFVLYFAAMSAITPPVALASYAAAALGRASVWGVSLTAFKLGMAGFLVPYLFIYRHQILMEGTPAGILFEAGIAIVAIVSLAAALQLEARSWAARGVWLVGGLALLMPDVTITLAALGAVALATFWEVRCRRRAASGQTA
ncbi:MAG: TRAP transporter fused permease subunit [Paracoccaceae bacterium]|jgi:TRAP transporter 4TM/12TM fusion protein|nr:TRAP transporter fused permease subunit [Paracoccaceae bacterium]